MRKPSPKYLRSLISYDQVSGLLRWKVTRNNFVRAGRIAGSVNADGYVMVKIDGVTYPAAHIAWAINCGRWPKDQLDHDDRNRSNNRINLAETDHQGNCKNRQKRADNTSGVTGVTFHLGRWQARISVGKRRISLGHFDTIAEAAAARCMVKAGYGYHPNHGV